MLHRFGESELHQGPLQVVPRSIAAGIHIALQVIREKAQAKLQGDQADAVGQIVQVPVTKEPTSNGEIARENRLTELHVEVHIVEAEGFLSGWIAATGFWPARPRALAS